MADKHVYETVDRTFRDIMKQVNPALEKIHLVKNYNIWRRFSSNTRVHGTINYNFDRN